MYGSLATWTSITVIQISLEIFSKLPRHSLFLKEVVRLFFGILLRVLEKFRRKLLLAFSRTFRNPRTDLEKTREETHRSNNEFSEVGFSHFLASGLQIWHFLIQQRILYKKSCLGVIFSCLKSRIQVQKCQQFLLSVFRLSRSWVYSAQFYRDREIQCTLLPGRRNTMYSSPSTEKYSVECY